VTAVSLGARAARLCALERRLFETVGTWVPETADPGLKVLLRRQSLAHAERSVLWEGLLAVSAPVPDPPAGGSEEDERLLAPLAGAAGAADRARALYGGVLPTMLAALRAARERLAAGSGGPADGPERRVLALAARAIGDDLAAARRPGVEQGGPGSDPGWDPWRYQERPLASTS